MENEVEQHGAQDVEKGASIYSFRHEYEEQRKTTTQSKKKGKNIHTPKENRKQNDSNESSQVKPFINMYDPFG